jgi:hypothetical protein
MLEAGHTSRRRRHLRQRGHRALICNHTNAAPLAVSSSGESLRGRRAPFWVSSALPPSKSGGEFGRPPPGGVVGRKLSADAAGEPNPSKHVIFLTVISKVSYTCCVSGTFRGFRGRCFVMGPAPRRGRFSGICDWFSGVSESWWVRWVLGPALITGPPVAVLAYFDLDLGSTGLPKWLISTLSEHKLPAVIVAAVWIYAFTAVQAALQACAKANEGIDNKALLGLFETIERVVGSKARRFEGVLRTLRESPKAAAAVFSEITQPEQQIAVLAHGLHAFFGSIGPSVDCFKVTIAKIDEFGKPCAWMYYVPDSDPPRTPLETLRGVRPRHDVTLRSIL